MGRPVKRTADCVTRWVIAAAADRLLVGLRRADACQLWIDACAGQSLTAELQRKQEDGIPRG